MCYDRSNLRLAHSSVQNLLGSSALDPNRGPSAPILIQRLARRPVHRRSSRLRPSRPWRLPPLRGQPGRARSPHAIRERRLQAAASADSPGPGAASTPRRHPTQPLPGPPWHKWRKWPKAAAWTLAFLQPPGEHQISHSETFDNSLSLNDPPNTDRPNIDRNLKSAIEVP